MEKQKYEREIEEILAKYYEESGRREREKDRDKARAPERPAADRPIGFRPAPPPPQPRKRSAAPRSRRWGAGQFMLAAFAMAILAIFVRTFSPALAGIMVLASVVLFLVPIFLVRSPGSGSMSGGWTLNEQKRWRGQVIDFNTRRKVTGDPFARIRRWFRRK